MLIDFFITEPETIVIVSWNAEEDAPVVARRERGARVHWEYSPTRK